MEAAGGALKALGGEASRNPANSGAARIGSGVPDLANLLGALEKFEDDDPDPSRCLRGESRIVP
jgi:hypothetical protein